MPNPRRKVIHLQPDDEINTAVRLVREAETPEVVLVLPEEPRIGRNEIHIRLLSEQAAEAGRTVHLITPDQRVRALGESHGIPVHADLQGYLAWPGQPGLSAAVHGGRARGQRFVVLVLIIAGVAGLAYGLTPKVTVTVTPDLRRVVHAVQVAAEPVGVDRPAGGEGASAADFLRLQRLARPVEAALATQATGRRVVGLAPARGVVTFLNAGSAPVRVPRGATVQTGGGVAFATLADVTVPPVRVSYVLDVPAGTELGQAEAEVEAVLPGTQGNVAAGQIRHLEGDLGGQVKVVNPAAFHGGADGVVPVVAPGDVTRARQALLRRLDEEGRRVLSAGMAGDEVWLGGELEWVDLEVAVAPPVGAEADEVLLTARATALAWVARREHVMAQLRRQIALPEGFDLLGEPALLGSRVVVREDATLAAEITIEAHIVGHLDGLALARHLAGVPLAEARRRLRAAPVSSFEIAPAAAEQLPRWYPWIRVEIVPPVSPGP